MLVNLTAVQTAALQAWLDEAKVALRLQHWYIQADASPPEDDDGRAEPGAYAGSYIRDNSDTATVHLGDAFWKDTPEGQRETLTHELLHCHLYRLHSFWVTRLKRGDQELAKQLEELAVEQLARIIAPQLNLPDIPAPAGMKK